MSIATSQLGQVSCFLAVVRCRDNVPAPLRFTCAPRRVRTPPCSAGTPSPPHPHTQDVGGYYNHGLHASHRETHEEGSEDAISAALRASVAEAEARELAKANAVLVRQHVSSKLLRLPPAPRDPTGAREYQLETAFVEERNEFARILADLERELEEVKARNARFAGAGGDYVLQARVAELEEAQAQAESAMALLRRERNMALQQTDLWAASAKHLRHIVDNQPRVVAAGADLKAAQGGAKGRSRADARLAMENDALREKLTKARAAADAREYEIAKEREFRVMTNGKYADRDVDILKIQNANLVRDLKTLAHDNLRAKRRYKLAKHELKAAEVAVEDAQAHADPPMPGRNYRSGPAPRQAHHPFANVPSLPVRHPHQHPMMMPHQHQQQPMQPMMMMPQQQRQQQQPMMRRQVIPGVVQVPVNPTMASSVAYPPGPPGPYPPMAGPPRPQGLPTRVPGVVMM